MFIFLVGDRLRARSRPFTGVKGKRKSARFVRNDEAVGWTIMSDLKVRPTKRAERRAKQKVDLLAARPNRVSPHAEECCARLTDLKVGPLQNSRNRGRAEERRPPKKAAPTGERRRDDGRRGGEMFPATVPVLKSSHDPSAPRLAL